jgi:hypothetical protein
MSDPFQSDAVREAILRNELRAEERARNAAKVGFEPRFQEHLNYLDTLIASIPGPLVFRDEAERAEWRKFSKQWDRDSARFDREAADAQRAMKPTTAKPASSEARPMKPKPKPPAPSKKTEADRDALRAKFPDEFEHGYRTGYLGENQPPCDAAGYPIGFHTWPLDRKNTWYAGFNLGYTEREPSDG